MDQEDLKGEIWAICLEKLNTFEKDSSRPDLSLEKQLEHFLRSIVSNRLVNRFKKITKSVRSPCPKCPYYKGKERGCEAHYGNSYCAEKLNQYNISVESRNSLLVAVDTEYERPSDTEITDWIAGRELYLSVKDDLPEQQQKDLEKLMEYEELSKDQMDTLKSEINKVLYD